MPQDDTLLTTAQAGALLGKSARTVSRMAEAGRLVIAQKLPGPNGAYLFRAADVRAEGWHDAAQTEQASA